MHFKCYEPPKYASGEDPRKRHSMKRAARVDGRRFTGKTVVESEEKGEMGKPRGKRGREGEKVRKQGWKKEKRKKGENQGKMEDSDEIEGGRKGKREEGEEGRDGLLPTPSQSKRPMVERV
ncbi:hypothetical protein C1H46_034597 [Malus baccata]|uniref:Uncharacterized protein n=1 Tax=Malus baccata TaxID=106549 RepID=A0A540L047_MALBA|nr:hypothetical protein C1H46_034597 [Malus baccata]